MMTVAEVGASSFRLLRRDRRVRSGKLITDPMLAIPRRAALARPDQQSVRGFSGIQG
jgi:hypothetical protein